VVFVHTLQTSFPPSCLTSGCPPWCQRTKGTRELSIYWWWSLKPCPHWRHSRRFGRTATICHRIWRQSPNSATIVASVDRALNSQTAETEWIGYGNSMQ